MASLRACVMLAVMLRAASAMAEPREDALGLARTAESRGREGDYVAAVALFKAAWAVDPRAEYRCNVGVAYYRARDLPRAQLFLAECLARAGDLPEAYVAQVRAVLTAVEARLAEGRYAPVDLAIRPETAEVRVSTFAPDEPVPREGRIWLPLGAHTVEAWAPGHASRQLVLALSSPVPWQVAIELVPAGAEPIVSPPARAVAEPPTPRTPAMRGDVRAADTRTFLIGAVVGTVATTVGVGASVGLYLRAQRAADHAGQFSPGYEYDDAVEIAEDHRRDAYIVYGLTAVTATATGLLWWRWRSAPPATIAATPLRGGAGLAIGGRF